MRNTFARILLEEARKSPEILLITGDLGFGVLDEFASSLPKQFLNLGIAEQSMMSVAAGIASRGFRPFVYSIANFSTFRCLEQIRNDVSYMNNPVSIVSIGAGLGYGVHGYSHHAIEDLSIMRSFGNIDLYTPSDPMDVEAAIRNALSNTNPAYFRLGKGGEPVLGDSHRNSITPRIIQKGSVGAIFFTGSVGSRALEAAKLLSNRGYTPDIVSFPMLNDSSVIQFLESSRYEYIVTLEEHVLHGGFGSFILEKYSDLKKPIRITRLGIGDSVRKITGNQDYLLNFSGLTPSEIAETFVILASN